MGRTAPAQRPDGVILVVDDNPLIVNVLRSLLATEQYQVYTASNGREALDLLEGKSVDVIVCDVMMPELDGYGLYKSVRSQAKFAHIPFVFLTALGSQDEILQGKECGADDYVVKPFCPKQLLSVIRGKVARSNGLKNLSEERYEAYRKRVIHTLSHEFRTPLVAINTGTEILLDQKDSLELPRIQSLIHAIQRGGQRLERLVADFMVLQQIEAGIADRLFASRSMIVTISVFIEEYVERKIEEFGSEVALSLADHSYHKSVRIYEPQIADILDRLLSNACKFSPGQKIVEIQVYARSDEIAVEVCDRGIGLDSDRIQEAIDVFGQIDRERLEQQGGGLGLAIANRYAHIHNGSLEFANRPGGGSIVTLVLPIAPEQREN